MVTRASGRKELIGTLGALGDLSYRKSSSHHCNPTGPFGKAVFPEVPWRVNPVESGGGLIMDVGCHALDIIDYLIGPLEQVTGSAARRGSFPAGSVVEDVVKVSARTPAGCLVNCSWNFATPKQEDRSVVTVDHWRHTDVYL